MRPVYASDVYALGVTCIYLMTGKAPKNLDCDPITGEIDWFKNVNVSDSFAQILTTMLEVAVKNRYKSADEVLQALDIENHIDSLSESMISYSNVEENSSSLSKRNSVIPPGRNAVFSSRTAVSRISHRIGSHFTSRKPFTSGLSANRKINNINGNLSDKPKTKPKPVKVDAATILDAYASGRRDFARKDLSRQDLQKADLSESNFRNSVSIKTNFQNANLSSCDFRGSDMRQAILRGAKLNRTFLMETI